MLTYDYDLIYNAYYGTNGFDNGGYLIKHKRETDEDYQTRQENAYYLNYFAPITNSLVTPIFKKPAVRDWNGAKNFMELFVQDIDGNKTTIGEFMKRAALKAKLYGSCFIVVDNFSTYSEDETVADVLKNRKIPYAFCLAPQQVTAYEADKIGIITSIDFQDIKQINSDAGKYYAMHFDKTSWKRYDDKNIYETGTHNLGRVPVTVLTCKQLEDMTLKPPPELLPLAKVAKAIYNTSSWLTEIFRSVTFPLLTIPSLDAKNIVIGRNVKHIGYNPFAWCENLLLESLSPEFPCENGIIYDKNFTHILCATDRAVGKYFKVRDSVTHINRGAFSGCIDLVRIDLNGIKCIDKSAFTNCMSLKYVFIPDSVTYIGEWAFAHCTSLKYISIPHKTFVDKNAFNECNTEIVWRG